MGLTLKTRVFIAALFSLGLVAAAVPTTGAEETCFTAEQRPEAGMRVYRQARPPVDDDEAGYRYWPATDVVTGQLDQIERSRAKSIGSYYFLWSNRCHRLEGIATNCPVVRKGNFLQPRFRHKGEEVRPYFTTYEAANTCTLIQAGHVLGEERNALENKAEQAGITLVNRGDDLTPHIRDSRFVDLCILPDHRLAPKAKGIALDYEVSDGRSPEMTLAFLTEFAALVRAHGKSPILYANPLDAPSQRWTNINKTNAPMLHRLFDKIVVLLWHNNKQGSIAASFASQLDVLRGVKGDQKVDPGKIIVVFELADTTIEEAKIVRRLMREAGIRDVMLWRHYADVGGSCDTSVNRKISCLVFGTCP
jgi:hypothetical protein